MATPTTCAFCRSTLPWTRRRFLAGVAVAGLAERLSPSARAAEPRFAATVTPVIAGKTARLALTGTANRTKYLVSVYTLASYVSEGVAVASPEALATLDAPKQLILAFQRDVDGATMASSFRDSIGRNHPAPAFATELASLERYFVANPVRSGDRVTLTHLPTIGMGVQINARPPITIPSVRFAQATWGTYLGPKPLDVALKTSLTARLR